MWDDLWLGRVPKLAFPELYSFAKKPSLSFSQARTHASVSQLFNLPLSVEAFDQWLLLGPAIQNLPWSEEKDV
jgi:hypothetical protein